MTRNELIERLESGEVGREIDEAIFLLFNPEPSGNGWKKTSIGNWHKFVNDQGRWTENVHAEPVSTSLDAAKAFADKVIENSDLIVHFMGHRVQATTDYDRQYYPEHVPDFHVYAPTGPAAICALALQHALLKATDSAKDGGE